MGDVRSLSLGAHDHGVEDLETFLRILRVLPRQDDVQVLLGRGPMVRFRLAAHTHTLDGGGPLATCLGLAAHVLEGRHDVDLSSRIGVLRLLQWLNPTGGLHVGIIEVLSPNGRCLDRQSAQLLVLRYGLFVDSLKTSLLLGAVRINVRVIHLACAIVLLSALR